MVQGSLYYLVSKIEAVEAYFKDNDSAIAKQKIFRIVAPYGDIPSWKNILLWVSNLISKEKTIWNTEHPRLSKHLRIFDFASESLLRSTSMFLLCEFLIPL